MYEVLGTHLVLGADCVQSLLGLGAVGAVRLGVHHYAVLAHGFFHRAATEGSS